MRSPRSKSLGGLVRLESLTLVRSRIGKDGFAHLAGLKNLHFLNLEGTNVDDNAALASLKGLTALTELNLGGLTNESMYTEIGQIVGTLE